MPENGFGGGADTETTAVVEAIGRSPLFRGVPERDLAAIAPMLRQRRYRAGETIFHEGDPGDAMHVIASGRAKISIESPEGGEAILVTLGPERSSASSCSSTARPARRRPSQSNRP